MILSKPTLQIVIICNMTEYLVFRRGRRVRSLAYHLPFDVFYIIHSSQYDAVERVVAPFFPCQKLISQHTQEMQKYAVVTCLVHFIYHQHYFSVPAHLCDVVA